MSRITTLLTLLLLSPNLFSQTLNLIPYPREISQTGENLILDQAPNIVASGEETKALAELLASDIFRLTGLTATANPEVFGSSSFSVLDLVSDSMYEGIGILVREILDVFHTSPYFHIGADEASLNSAFMDSEHIKAFMEAHDYSGEDLQRMYVTKLDSMAWESFKADNTHEKIKIPTDMLINVWETLCERPENYLKAGFDIINSRWKRWNPEVIYNFSKFSFANLWIYAPSYNQVLAANLEIERTYSIYPEITSPIIAHLTGLKKQERAIEPYAY